MPPCSRDNIFADENNETSRSSATSWAWNVRRCVCASAGLKPASALNECRAELFKPCSRSAGPEVWMACPEVCGSLCAAPRLCLLAALRLARVRRLFAVGGLLGDVLIAPLELRLYGARRGAQHETLALGHRSFAAGIGQLVHRDRNRR